MFASPFMRHLANLRQQLPAGSLYYMARETAYEKLKELSGEDFGYDDKRWEKWGVENKHFLPGFEPPSGRGA
jgi:hypothetical protein